MPNNYEEHYMQKAVIEWSDTVLIRLRPDLMINGHSALTATPNGNTMGTTTDKKSGARRGKWANDEGRRKGVPDLRLDYPTEHHRGLVIEMKTAKGKITPEQHAWFEWYDRHGFYPAICRSTADAIAVIKHYLGLEG